MLKSKKPVEILKPLYAIWKICSISDKSKSIPRHLCLLSRNFFKEVNYSAVAKNLGGISGLLTSFGKNFLEALISKEPTKIVDKLSVNSRCNSIYKSYHRQPWIWQ